MGGWVGALYQSVGLELIRITEAGEDLAAHKVQSRHLDLLQRRRCDGTGLQLGGELLGHGRQGALHGCHDDKEEEEEDVGRTSVALRYWRKHCVSSRLSSTLTISIRCAASSRWRCISCDESMAYSTTVSTRAERHHHR